MAVVRRDNLAAQAALRDFPKPTVAMIRGHCIGGGVEIAACCDLRFTDPTGVFGVTPAKVGIVYTPSSTKALIDLVGPAMTKYLLFSGELIDAPTALRAGLVDRLVPADDLAAEVHRFAGVLAGRSALTQRATKEVVAALAAGGDGEAEVAALVPGDHRHRRARRGSGRLRRAADSAVSLVRLTETFLFRLRPAPGYQSGCGAP